jgi:hypothetical protein
MRSGRRYWLVLLVVATVPSTSAGQQLPADAAQVPMTGARTATVRIRTPRTAAERLPLVVDRARVAELDSLLPILDDAGQVITEDDIRAAMSDGGGRRLMYTTLGALIGALVLYNAVPGNLDADCSVYEPCTEREEFYRDWSVVVGGVTGALITGMAPEYGRDRFEAVEYIRALRRGATRVR